MNFDMRALQLRYIAKVKNKKSFWNVTSHQEVLR